MMHFIVCFNEIPLHLLEDEKRFIIQNEASKIEYYISSNFYGFDETICLNYSGRINCIKRAISVDGNSIALREVVIPSLRNSEFSEYVSLLGFADANFCSKFI